MHSTNVGHPPRAMERLLAGVWAEVLRKRESDIRADDSFFSVGGDSLSIAQVMERVNCRLRRPLGREDVPITHFFRYPTLAALAASLSEDAGEAAVAAAASSPAAESRAPVAIVGMAGRFPGAPDPESLWSQLCSGAEGIGCQLDGLDQLDAEYFGLTAREASLTCPQQRLLLECAVEALQRAGYGVLDADARVGVFVATGYSTYLAEHTAPQIAELGSMAGMAAIAAATNAAARISYLLDLHGPSLTLDTACSSSLVAVHQACLSLRAGECDMALAGGASAKAFGERGSLYEPDGIVSPDGHCRPFDERAAGTVFTNGAGVVALKLLDRAIADRDTIHAVILGSAINNDGRRKMAYSAPSASGQEQVIRAALANARAAPEGIVYVETHGTATALGDSIEIDALTRALGPHAPRATERWLGALKSNIGHLEVAAGVAGLIKAAMVVGRAQLPPTLHFTKPHPHLDLERAGLRVCATPRRLEAAGPLRAGVSSFGIGGTNCHAIVQEPPSKPSSSTHRPVRLLPVSARSTSALRICCRELAASLASSNAPQIADVAFTLQVGRAAHDFRTFAVCASPEEAVATLARLADEPGDPGVKARDVVSIVFAFSAGAEGPPLQRDLYLCEPGFRSVVDRCAEVLLPRLGVDIRDCGFADVTDPLIRHFAECVSGIALAELWKAWGVKPRALLIDGNCGVAAAVAAGIVDLESALARNPAERDAGLPWEAAKVPVFAVVEDEIRSITPDRAESLCATDTVLGLTTGCGPRVRQLCERFGGNAVCLEAGENGNDHSTALAAAVGHLWQLGVPIDWSVYNAHNRCSRVVLPAYPFERARHWVERATARAHEATAPAPRRPVSDWLYLPTWKQVPDLAPFERGDASLAPTRSSCWLLFEGGEWLQRALGDALRDASVRVIRVRAGARFGRDGDGFTLDPSSAEQHHELFRQLAAANLKLGRVIHAWSVGQTACGAELPDAWSLECGLNSVRHVCRALDESFPGRPLQLTVVSSNAHAVNQDELLRPERTALAEAVRVLGNELKQCDCRAIDIPAADPGPRAASRIVRSLLDEHAQPATHRIVAYRGGSRWARVAEPVRGEAAARNPVRLRTEGVYLISGGLGAIGLALAEWLARSARARLVLVGRSVFPSRSEWDACLARNQERRHCEAIRRIRAMEMLGAEVEIVRGDITWAADVRAAVTRARERFGEINGIIHAAGSAGGGLVQLQQQAASRDVLGPKMTGTCLLNAHASGPGLDVFICCSSLATVIGPAGQFDYCAANAFQDAFCEALDDTAGVRYISIKWDAWREGGMAADNVVPLSQREARARKLETAIAVAEGKQIFARILERPAAQWLVSTGDLDAEIAPARREPARGTPAGENAERVVEDLAGIESELSAIWRELLGVTAVEPDDDFFLLGGDSMLAVELSSRIRTRLARRLPLRELMMFPTIAGMAERLQDAPRTLGESRPHAAGGTR